MRGDQPQRGHRMRGPDRSRLFSWSSSRSKTTEDFVNSSERAHMSGYYDPSSGRRYGGLPKSLLHHPSVFRDRQDDAAKAPLLRFDLQGNDIEHFGELLAVLQRYRPMNSSNKRLLHGVVFLRALHLIANLLEEEIVFASLTSSAIAVARCPTFVGYDSGTSSRAVRCRHFL